MFYNEIIYLFLALILWGSWPVREELALSWVLPLFLGKELLWIGLTWRLFATADSALKFAQRQQGLLRLALIFFFADVALLNLPGYFPGEFWAVLLYLHYLILGWLWAGRYEKRLYLLQLSAKQYLLAQLRLFLPVIIPWLLAYLVGQALERWYPAPEFFFWPLFIIILAGLFPYLAVRLWPTRPLPASSLRNLIENYLRRERLPLGEIYLWLPFEGRLLTAGIMGFLYPFRYLLLSPGLLSILTEEEVLSVVAHEVGHLKHRHLLWLLLFLIFFIFLVYFSLEPLWLLFLSYFPFPEWFLSPTLRFRLWPEILLILFLVIVVILYFRYFTGYFLRNFERQADLYALESLGTASGLISSLEKIAQLSGLKRAPNWHHFSIAERIRFLEEASRNPSLARKHHRKLRLRLLLSFLIISLTLLGGTLAQESRLKERAYQNIYRGLERRAEKHPELLRLLGDYLLAKGQEKEALRIYRKALGYLPEDPWLLNNLAWLLLTARQKELRKPSEALDLALRAVKYDPSPAILDTLAEAYSQNGKIQQACQAALQAYQKARGKDKRSLKYYQRRVREFCQNVTPSLPAL